MTGWRIHAWVLMGNHYHLMLQTPQANLVEGMKWMQNAFTRRFNTRHKQWGRLFGDRYKSVLVEGEGYYYETLMDYIHLNPVRAGLIRAEQGAGLLEYPWSSVAGGYVLAPAKRASWLAAADGLAAFGFSDTVAGRRGFLNRLHERMVSEGLKKAGLPVIGPEFDRRRSRLERGWYWGSEVFAERMLELGQSILKRERHWSYRGSMEAQAHGEQEARRLLKEGMQIAGLRPEELEELPGSEPRKAALAEFIWSNTTVNMEWINRELRMRSATNTRQQIRRLKLSRQSKGPKKEGVVLPGRLLKWLQQSQMSA